jgi:UDP-N-acetylglucosamine 4,6-dehydratase/5-epimerase
MFKNKILLITGGTGSFGESFLRKVLSSKILFKEIRIFSRDEKKQEDLRKNINNKNVKFIIGDVRDKESLNSAVNGSNLIFHAAALKQVPSCEFYPLEAIKTNILGTNNLIQLAVQHSVERVVCLSSDKAVYPINAMGMSKALMEKIAISNFNLNKNGPIISVTRYGNVLASRGSVVPLFINQILNNKPITITDPKMTRFIMPMDKAIQLVLFALKYGKGGEVFVQKTPATNIHNLLRAILSIFNKKNYKINIIGTRHGEKHYESLLTREEMAKAKDMGEYFRINSDQRDLNYDLYFAKGSKDISSFEDYNSNNAEQLTIDKTKKILLKLDIFKNKNYLVK